MQKKEQKKIWFLKVLFFTILIILFESLFSLPVRGADVNIPVKKCFPDSGIVNDVCNNGFARPGKTNASAANNGVHKPQQILFGWLDLTTALSAGLAWGFPYLSYPGQIVTADAQSALTLVDGDTYEWFVTAFDQFGGASASDTNPWYFVYDATNPTYSLNPPLDNCYTTGQVPQTINILATDPVPPGVGKQASGVGQVFIKFGNLPESQVNYDSNFGAYAYRIPFPLSYGLYRVFIKVVDNAGNTSGYPPNPDVEFLYANSCTGPWFQSTGGDVHSNVQINVSGGP